MTRRGIANDGKAEGPEGSHIGCRASFFPPPFLRRRSCRHSRNNSGNSRSGLVWSGPAAILVQVIRLGAASSILSVSFLADIAPTVLHYIASTSLCMKRPAASRRRSQGGK